MTMSAEEFVARMERKDEILPPPKCAICRQPLRESVTGCRSTSLGYVDSDCYFREIGKLVEEQPLRTARIRRG